MENFGIWQNFYWSATRLYSGAIIVYPPKHSEIDMNADDTTLDAAGKCVKTIESKLNEDLNDLYEWFCQNKLSLNAEKTQVMLIGTPKKLSTFRIASELKV